MPQVNSQVVGRQVRLTVAVDTDGIDVICMCVSKNTPWGRLYQEIHRPQDRDLDIAETHIRQEEETGKKTEAEMLHTCRVVIVERSFSLPSSSLRL